MARNWIARIGVLLFVCLCLAAIYFKRSPIEGDLAERSAARVPGDSFPWAQVHFQGRDAELYGIPPSDTERKAALKEVRSVWGVRTVADYTNATLEALWVLRKRAHGLEMTGAMPDSDFRDSLLLRIGTLLGEPVADRTTLIDGNVDKNWMQVVMVGVAQLGALDQGTMVVSKRLLSIAGESQHQGVAGRFERAYQSLLPKGYRGRTRIGWNDRSGQASMEARACRKGFDDLLSGRSVHFLQGSASLDESSKTLLAKLAEVLLSQCPNSRVDISAYVESGGDLDAELTLTRQRAEAVVRALQFAGVEPQHTVVRGFGPTLPPLGLPGMINAANRLEFRFLD